MNGVCPHTFPFVTNHDTTPSGPLAPKQTGMRRLFAVVLAVAMGSTAMGIDATASAAQPPSAAGSSDASSAEPESVPGELLVGYRPGATDGQRANARSRASAQLQDRVVRGEGLRGEVELVRLPAGADRSAAMRRLHQDPSVAYAEPNWVVTHSAASNDPYFTNGSLWGMYGDVTSPANQFGSQAGEAWAAGNTGSNAVFVGVIDEGIQVDHPDLAANTWTNPFDPIDGVDNDGNGYKDDVNGWDFDGNNNTVYDGGPKGNADKHGTHVAGTIGAKGGNGTGVAGVNWGVTMISGKFLGKRGGTTANAIRAVDYFTDLKTRHGMNVVATNNSWGGGGFSQALLDAINRGGNAGILFIAAAGNGGRDGVGDDNDKYASYPSTYRCTANGTYDCVIAVAAITSSGAKSTFSNYGATTVDLGAPGSGISSTLPSNTYGSYSGTSMATPHVTGGAALYASTHAGATAAAIRQAIIEAATLTSTASLAGKTVTGGRLNVSGF